MKKRTLNSQRKDCQMSVLGNEDRSVGLVGSDFVLADRLVTSTWNLWTAVIKLNTYRIPVSQKHFAIYYLIWFWNKINAWGLSEYEYISLLALQRCSARRISNHHTARHSTPLHCKRFWADVSDKSAQESHILLVQTHGSTLVPGEACLAMTPQRRLVE